MLVRGQAAT